eukprot:scaffold59012_cov69-Cyclotella_meneghiniana.AAC.1
MASASISAWVPRRGTVWLERRWMVAVASRYLTAAAAVVINQAYGWHSADKLACLGAIIADEQTAIRYCFC